MKEPSQRVQRLMDLTIRVGPGHDLRLVERPGRSLGPDELQRLVVDLRDVADQCVPGGRLRYGVLSGDPARLEQAVIAFVYDRRSERPLGFNAMSWFDGTFGGRRRAVLHAGLCMIVPQARRSGFLGLLSSVPALLAFARNRFAPLWVTNVTQVPAAAGRFASAAGDVFPAPGRVAPPSTIHREIAAGVMDGHRHVFGVSDEAEFDTDRFIIRNAYTGGSDELKKTYERCCKHRDARVNRFCRESLDYDRGDDLLQVGKLTVGVIAELVWRLAAGVVKRRLSGSGARAAKAGRRPGSIAPAGSIAGIR